MSARSSSSNDVARVSRPRFAQRKYFGSLLRSTADHGRDAHATKLQIANCKLQIKTTSMTYCLGIVTKYGLVMASDSRTNAGTDQVSVCRKMFTFEKPGERVFVVLTSGGLSLSQSVLTLLEADCSKGQGL